MGRRWNVDPIVKVWESSYGTFGGNPILFSDPNGDDWYKSSGKKSRWTWSDKVKDQKSAEEVGGKGSSYAHIGYIYKAKNKKYVELGGNGKWEYLKLDHHMKEIIAGRYVYTQNYGWVDKGHAFKGNGPVNLFIDVSFPDVSENECGDDGHKVSYTQGSGWPSWIFTYSQDYCVKNNLTYDEQIAVTCAIFQEVSVGYENKQSYANLGGLGMTSGFSPEDLPSNMLGLYRSIYYMSYNEKTIMNLIKPLTITQSLEVYRAYPGTFTSSKYKNHTFNPIFFPNRYSPANPQVPAELQTIKPASMGSLFNYFNK